MVSGPTLREFMIGLGGNGFLTNSTKGVSDRLGQEWCQDQLYLEGL